MVSNITRFFIVVCGVMVSTVSLCTEFPVDWQANWDYLARPLPADAGEPSKAAFVVQPRGGTLDFFGWLGWFPSSDSQSLVGFSQIETSQFVGASRDSVLVLVAATDSPQVKFRVTLQEYNDPDDCSFQAAFSFADSALSKKTFESSDFRCWRRGIELPVTRRVHFENIRTLGFLVTKSSQNAELAKARASFPFGLSVKSVGFVASRAP